MKYDRDYILKMHTTKYGNDKMAIEYFINVLSQKSNFDKIYDNNLKMGQYAFCDVVGWKNMYPSYIELKTRKNTYSYQYPDAGLSKHKYLNILNNAITTSGRAWYVAFYLDGYAVIDLLNDAPDRFGNWSHKQTTEFANNIYMTEQNCPFWNIENKIHPYVYK